MIRVLLIEDEIPARNKLLRFLKEKETQVREAGSLKEANEWLSSQAFDVIVSDIELLDGNVFSLFKDREISCPILFTTAYDQFWTDAFDTRGIDYLLKPFSQERFDQAWDKFLWLREGQEKRTLEALKALVHGRKYKSRFPVSTSQGTYYLLSKDIVFIEAEEGVLFAYDQLGKRHLLSGVQSLREMEEMLDKTMFFRINRSEMVAKDAIERTDRYDKNSLIIYLRNQGRRLKTSQTISAAFRSWLED
jgi:DNA-binding LytR/AlgR family response regulator